jgi:hypothetical protein
MQMNTLTQKTWQAGDMQNEEHDRILNPRSASENGPRPDHREGRVARAIEQQTAKLPSDTFLWAAVGSMGLSLALEVMGEEKKANFVGHWAPTLLILGLYNKLVKLQGSDGA